MLHFIVPFKSKQVSRDWAKDSALCLRTVQSLLDQTTDAFTVTVSCHQRPEGFDAVVNHPSIRLLERPDFWVPPDPSYNPGLLSDKDRKIREALKSLREFERGYAMPVDADDTVSTRLVEHVLSKPGDVDLFYADRGYLYDQSSNLLFEKRGIYRMTATSLVGKWKADELPENADDKDAACLFADFYHNKLVTKTKEDPSLTVQAIPFPSVCYVVGTGLNMIGAGFETDKDRTLGEKIQTAGKALSRFWQLRYPGASWRNEFGFSQHAIPSA